MKSKDVERTLYLAQRTMGDVRAAQKGTLPKRLAKRVWHRKLVGLLRKGGVW